MEADTRFESLRESRELEVGCEVPKSTRGEAGFLRKGDGAVVPLRVEGRKRP